MIAEHQETENNYRAALGRRRTFASYPYLLPTTRADYIVFLAHHVVRSAVATSCMTLLRTRVFLFQLQSPLTHTCAFTWELLCLSPRPPGLSLAGYPGRLLHSPLTQAMDQVLFAVPFGTSDMNADRHHLCMLSPKTLGFHRRTMGLDGCFDLCAPTSKATPYNPGDLVPIQLLRYAVHSVAQYELLERYFAQRYSVSISDTLCCQVKVWAYTVESNVMRTPRRPSN